MNNELLEQVNNLENENRNLQTNKSISNRN